LLSEDVPALPTELQSDFEQLYKPILKANPNTCGGFPHHALRGDLASYYALKIFFDVAYRLVDRVYEKPAPRRVLILSFAEHDPAYEKALARIGKG